MYMMPFVNGSRNIMAEMMNDMMTPFTTMRGNAFRTDVRETEEAYEIAADLPGVKVEDIDISVNSEVLTVTANFGGEEKTEKDGYTHIERRTGKFSRAFNIRGVEKDDIKAKYENGVLTLTLPKIKKAVPETRKIAIEGAPEKKEDGAA